MNWQVDAAIASIVSAMAVVASTIFVVVHLRQAARERYFEITAFLFQNFEAMMPECRECYVPLATDTAATPVKDVDLIEPDEARRLLGQNAAIMLDVSRDNTNGHISGAVRSTPNDLTGWLAAIKPGKDVITYCT